MQRWYALYTKPHKESHVLAALAMRNIEAYLPSVLTPQSRNPNARVPFFPCYLFVHADLNSIGLWSLQYLPGTRRLVMFGNTPASVSDTFIETLKTRLTKFYFTDTHGNALKPGDRVVITSGPFLNTEAIFDRKLSATGRVRVLIDLLQRSTPVELDAGLLRKKVGMIHRSAVPNYG